MAYARGHPQKISSRAQLAMKAHKNATARLILKKMF
jgi:hypothetical protein